MNKLKKSGSFVVLQGRGCILRSPADSDAFRSGRYAEHNGHPKTIDFIV